MDGIMKLVIDEKYAEQLAKEIADIEARSIKVTEIELQKDKQKVLCAMGIAKPETIV
jgi:RNA-binding protein YlmH